MDRAHYPTRLVGLHDDDQNDDEYIRSLSPGERFQMVWTLTLQAWAFMEIDFEEPRMRRDIVQVFRNGVSASGERRSGHRRL